MRKIMILSVLGILCAAEVMAHGAVQVSCYRGPWKKAIWDRPNAIFIDTLVANGYRYATAEAIGERICRDQRLVGNSDGLAAEMTRILRTIPKDG